MTDFIKTLTRKNSLRKQTQELGVSELEKVMSDLADILEERREEEVAKAEAEAAKVEAIEAIRKQMMDAGIALEELASQVDTAPRKSVKAKYVIEVDGEEHHWSGRGRTPVVFAQYMEEKGISKEQLPTV
ncbi:DNA-binding protein H-NS [Marinobacterium lacunae]|uniref:DNA-binding protein n=1 Tax=Marinobacterium lacunae TaxID=1232683 RepID=A0A081G3T5_9GAMM|nr:H-NS family nucleoid-associated regulatory protein [Marinobacterium lacunae]KEA65440.1 DNA-binding protein H-NS [Marinobacterium lacunae]MBR9882649.1 H-NS histone family protein [Oceanospirillales bacterium]